VVFGDPKKIESILAESSVSKKINTAYVERNNGTIRRMDSRCVRKTFCFFKEQDKP
jgi:IS1 family transposase